MLVSGPGQYRPLAREARNLLSLSWWLGPPGGPRKLWGLVTMGLHNAWVRARESVCRRLGRPPRVECPLCGYRGQDFLTGLRGDWGLRYGRQCPQCRSRERHRFLWLVLRERYRLQDWAGCLVHFAPEASVRQAIARETGARYVGVDIDPTGVDLGLDITHLPLRDGSVSYILCSHVLEHIPDHGAALAELRRCLAPAGVAFVAVPLFGETTRQFSRPDPHLHGHVRAYGRDVRDLLAQHFDVTVHEVGEEYSPEVVQRFRLLVGEVFYACRPRRLTL